MGKRVQLGGVNSELAYIMPFSLHSKVRYVISLYECPDWLAQSQAHVAIEAFTGETIAAEDVAEYVNAPENALLLQHDAHDYYDKRFAWGIEAFYGNDGSVSILFLPLYPVSHIL
jgi:hypothetical protein